MIKELTRLATHLDSKGLRGEADYLDAVIKKLAEHTDCASLSAELKTADNEVALKQKDYDEVCTDEGKHSQSCINAQVGLELAIDKRDKADDAYAECTKAHSTTDPE